MTQESGYRVIERLGWSYVVGSPPPNHSGPWRYGWEAQEYADELNARRADGEHVQKTEG